MGAMPWAVDTTGHRSSSAKFVLTTLAFYFDQLANFANKGYSAWPSQATLADTCEISIRTVQWCLKALRDQGFITIVQKGNQHQPTIYKLNFGVTNAHETS
jgi:biotin operon repressor